MKVVIQRVSSASVTVEGTEISRIGRGLLILLGVAPDDDTERCRFLAGKCARLRIFEDGEGKMNLSVLDTEGEVLVVSQFTLLGDARKGNRPSFTGAAHPSHAVPLYEEFVNFLETLLPGRVRTGEFGADMKVALVNDGPVTLLLDSDQWG